MNPWQRLKGRLKFRLSDFALGSYYRCLFGRRFPGSRSLQLRVCQWERHCGSVDIPLPKEEWEWSYRTGKWEFIEAPDEHPRYDAVIAAIQRHKSSGRMLDVGCGTGILYRRMQPADAKRYTGIEISETALAKLQSIGDGMGTFICGDAETYMPAEHYDSIIFNETLIYLSDPLGAIERYAPFLTAPGVIIVSSYTQLRRTMAILRLIKSRHQLVSEARVGDGKKSWICSVFKPR